MKFSDIIWNENGWTDIQQPDEAKHVLGIMCYAENGVVTKVRACHNDGEEYEASVTADGEKILPLALDDFKKLFKKGKMEIR